MQLNQRCIEWNPPQTAPPWIGQHLFALYPHVDRNNLREYERALRGERFTVFRDRRALGLTTGPAFVSVSYGPVVTGDEITGLSVISVDVSEVSRHEQALRAANERLEAAVSARDEFLGLVSHELRTPLTIMRLNTELLGRALEREQYGRLRDVHDALRENQERLSRTIDNMLALARIEAGADNPLEPVMVSRLAEDVIERYRRWHPNRALAISVQEEAPVLLQADHVAQIIDNLVTNALKYSPGAIEVIVTQTASETAVHVVDEGPGLEPDLIAHLFEPFSRGPSVRVGGLGLGLNVCKRLVEAYGGKLWAENRKTGGAIFAFSFPVEPLQDA